MHAPSFMTTHCTHCVFLQLFWKGSGELSLETVPGIIGSSAHTTTNVLPMAILPRMQKDKTGPHLFNGGSTRGELHNSAGFGHAQKPRCISALDTFRRKRTFTQSRKQYPHLTCSSLAFHSTLTPRHWEQINESRHIIKIKKPFPKLGYRE